MADQHPAMVHLKLNIFHQTLDFSLIIEIAANLLTRLSSFRLGRDFSLLREVKTVQPFHPQTSLMIIPSIKQMPNMNSKTKVRSIKSLTFVFSLGIWLAFVIKYKNTSMVNDILFPFPPLTIDQFLSHTHIRAISQFYEKVTLTLHI